MQSQTDAAACSSSYRERCLPQQATHAIIYENTHVAVNECNPTTSCCPAEPWRRLRQVTLKEAPAAQCSRALRQKAVLHTDACMGPTALHSTLLRYQAVPRTNACKDECIDRSSHYARRAQQ